MLDDGVSIPCVGCCPGIPDEVEAKSWSSIRLLLFTVELDWASGGGGGGRLSMPKRHSH